MLFGHMYAAEKSVLFQHMMCYLCNGIR